MIYVSNGLLAAIALCAFTGHSILAWFFGWVLAVVMIIGGFFTTSDRERRKNARNWK